MKHNDLTNKTILITGATSGIGEACAHHFAKLNAKILVCARREERLRKLVSELQKKYKVNAKYLTLDIANKKAVIDSFEKLEPEWKNIDILINNAGTARGFQKLHEGKLDDWDAMIDINLKGLLYVTRQVLPGMVARNQGHVINVGSVAGHEVYANGTVYASTKHAVNAITKALRLDLFGTKIRVTTVDPGLVETEFSLVRFKGDQQKAKDFYAGLTPLTADDVADSILYCASCPAHVNISELIIMPTDQANITTVNRK
ncbi:MAG: SDR family NAD(P)-dependent oxidoreductase [Gammaproteobacteria bacterium]|jgi:serine 3-dehydrogenase